MLTQETLKQYVNYDPATGIFISLVNRGPCTIGSQLGSVCLHGYITFMIYRKSYKAHRLAWLYVHGEWPSKLMDHINGNKTDNRIENLRLVSSRQNNQNRKSHRLGRLQGCHKIKNLWQARILINGVRKNLGCYKTEQQAHEAYLHALSKLNETLIS